eukprot:gb/GECH01004895.1/.p1 GENE.gb/GECH01004895.1/~~gb/GECH01004895.1/.p1  ORF type:complete len:622 (+),score=167.07 gb/GECH01004895.1/:1-1866(+)
MSSPESTEEVAMDIDTQNDSSTTQKSNEQQNDRSKDNQQSCSSTSTSDDNSKTYMIGSEGAQRITDLLSTTDPRTSIPDFQKEAALKVGDCGEVLELTDLLDVKRQNIYLSLMQKLKNTMLSYIKELPENKLDEMLKDVFPYVGTHELRPVAFELLKRHRNIPSRYLKQLKSAKEIYEESPMEVKRQIWASDIELFRKEIFPLIDDFRNDPVITTPVDILSDSIDDPRKRRKRSKPLKQIVHMIGSSIQLYDSVLHFLRTLFINTENSSFCSLRSNLLMMLHDNGLSQVYKQDPCHYIAWCLDAWQRVGYIDSRRLADLKSYSDSLKSGEPAWGDAAMIMKDPFLVNVLIRNIFHSVHRLAKHGGTPQSDEILVMTSKVLTVAFRAKDMITNQSYSVKRLNKDWKSLDKDLKKFYALIIQFLQDQNFSQEIIPIMSRNMIAFHLVLVCTLAILKEQNYDSFLSLLEIICTEIDVSLMKCQTSFIHSLVSQIAKTKDDSNAEPVYSKVLDEFLEPLAVEWEFAHKEAVRLIIHLITRNSVNSQKLKEILQRLNSNGKCEDDEGVKRQYTLLCKKIHSSPRIENKSEWQWLFDSVGFNPNDVYQSHHHPSHYHGGSVPSSSNK